MAAATAAAAAAAAAAVAAVMTMTMTTVCKLSGDFGRRTSAERRGNAGKEEGAVVRYSFGWGRQGAGTSRGDEIVAVSNPVVRLVSSLIFRIVLSVFLRVRVSRSAFNRA